MKSTRIELSKVCSLAQAVLGLGTVHMCRVREVMYVGLFDYGESCRVAAFSTTAVSVSVRVNKLQSCGRQHT